MMFVIKGLVVSLLFVVMTTDVFAQNHRETLREIRREDRSERRALGDAQRARRDSLRSIVRARESGRRGMLRVSADNGTDTAELRLNDSKSVIADMRPISAGYVLVYSGRNLISCSSDKCAECADDTTKLYLFPCLVDKQGRIHADIYDCTEEKHPRYDEWYSNLHDADNINRKIESVPPFGIFKDNYIVTGSSFSGGKVTRYNSDVKFQISFRHRLVKGVLPYNTHLFIAYTQKSFWDIYRESKPFRENNYNPAIGLSNYITINKKVACLLLLQYEHESNGRDSIFSRSWNLLSLTGVVPINPNLTLHAKVWFPHALDDPNKDLVQYAGYATIGANYLMCNRRLSFSASVTKRGGWNLNANFQLEAAFRISKRSNQFVCLQYYNGYGENLIEYNQYHSYLRIGIVIKSRYINVY